MPLQREEGAKTITRTFEHKFDGKKLITKVSNPSQSKFLSTRSIKTDIDKIYGLNKRHSVP